MAVPLRPPPSSLMTVGFFQQINKEVPKKLFFLNGKPMQTPPPLNGTAIKNKTFFAASANKKKSSTNSQAINVDIKKEKLFYFRQLSKYGHITLKFVGRYFYLVVTKIGIF